MTTAAATAAAVTTRNFPSTDEVLRKAVAAGITLDAVLYLIGGASVSWMSLSARPPSQR